MTSPSNSVVNLQAFKTQKLHNAVGDIVSTMSSEDLHTLQNDILTSPLRRSILPACLAEDFRQWLNDSYSPVEREDKMAPECQAETETMFLEEVAIGDDEVSAVMAVQLLATGMLAPMRVRPAEEPKPDQPGAN